jgi:aldose 1-epimerase
MKPADIHALAGGDWLLKIDAARGGQISECRWRGHEVFCTATPGRWPSDTSAGCFTLVPYSNRIRSGVFGFAGHCVSLTEPEFAGPHALHGLGWRRAWSYQQSQANEATLLQTHHGGAWPWPYRARQHFSIDRNRLTMTLEIENTGASLMPAGIGFHPYFPRRPDMNVALNVNGKWNTSPKSPGLPEDWFPLDPLTNLFDDKDIHAIDLDNCFTGWSRTIRIDYASPRFCIEISASPAFSNLVIYCPAGKNVLCLEPVSHVNDAMNLSGLDFEQKMDPLAPGECLRGTMTVEVSELS